MAVSFVTVGISPHHELGTRVAASSHRSRIMYTIIHIVRYYWNMQSSFREHRLNSTEGAGGLRARLHMCRFELGCCSQP